MDSKSEENAGFTASGHDSANNGALRSSRIDDLEKRVLDLEREIKDLREHSGKMRYAKRIGMYVPEEFF